MTRSCKGTIERKAEWDSVVLRVYDCNNCNKLNLALYELFLCCIFFQVDVFLERLTKVTKDDDQQRELTNATKRYNLQ